MPGSSTTRASSTRVARRWRGSFWRTDETPALCTADQTEAQSWAEWDRQAQQGRRISRLHGWSDTGTAREASSGRIRLHIKILAEPEVPVAVMLERMREVYGAAGFQVDIASVENLDSPDLIDVDVDRCVMSSPGARRARRSKGPSVAQGW